MIRILGILSVVLFWVVTLILIFVIMITKNRKAYFEFSIIEEYDCGIILTGSEVKSIRGVRVS